MVVYNEKLITEPAEEPLSISEAETWLKLDAGAETALLTSLIKSARQQIETDYHCAIVTQVWNFYMDGFPGSGDDTIVIPRTPVQSVDEIKYYDANGTLQTLGTDVYQWNTTDILAQIKLQSGKTWPATESGKLNSVQIKATLGYGAAAAVPEPIKDAIRVQIAFRYENREDIPLGLTSWSRTTRQILHNYFDRIP